MCIPNQMSFAKNTHSNYLWISTNLNWNPRFLKETQLDFIVAEKSKTNRTWVFHSEIKEFSLWGRSTQFSWWSLAHLHCIITFLASYGFVGHLLVVRGQEIKCIPQVSLWFHQQRMTCPGLSPNKEQLGHFQDFRSKH